MLKIVAGGSALVVAAVAVGACYGAMDGGAVSETGEDRAALVAKKRKWLEGFDRHCDACFVAFDLCQAGAAPEELDACRVAMDACIRGGLGEELDAGASEEDAGRADAGFDEDGGLAPIDEDAGLDDDGDVDEEIEEGFDEDGGLSSPPDVDIDAGLEGEDAGDDIDAGGGDEDEVDRAKEVLIQQVDTCLELARGCLEPEQSDVAQCVRSLGACVQQALEEAFEVVCSEQVRACREENASREKVRRVERECRASLLI